MMTLKAAIFLWFVLTASLVHAQQPSNPPPMLPCGTLGHGDDLPCLKDGKIVVKRSGNYVPFTPLSPDAIAALADAKKQATETEPPITTIPKPPARDVKPYKTNEPPSTTPAADVQGYDAAVPQTKQAPATTNSPNSCHDFWSCFSQGYSQAVASKAAIATMDQQNRRLAAENQQEERRFAEKTFNDMEKVRKMITEDTAGSTPNDPPMVKEAIQQEKDSWSSIRKIFCEHSPRASYIDLDGKPQPCTQPPSN
jgi:hypothetical protein